ncbi:ABC transporter permease [Niabella aurantiaca]|uniref:ABC transporter permease n=1 Tax=Niabella aurantiaca TaxID=379900 RepID=UPI000377A4CB|nr:ABC transporter permease [Niabella aurantiaca]
MIRNYIKIAWRNIRKHPLHSGVNIIGLFAGILFFFLIGAYVWGELQVNRGLKNVKDQYILTSVWKDPNMGYDLATLGPLAKRLKQDYPQLVKNYYRYDGISSIVVKGDKRLKEEVQLGDSTLLTMYGFKTLHGDPATALNEPFSVVVTKGIAEKYFNRTDIVGERIALRSFRGEIHDFKITAVLDVIPENTVTSLTPDYPSNIFVPTANYTYFGRNDLEHWNNIQIASYIELHDGVVAGDLAGPIRQLLRQNTPANIQSNLTVKPVGLTEYHLSRNNAFIKRMIYTLSLVALFILMMAVINFVNVSITSAGTRMREIGVRKVIGGLRKQLVLQFLSESVILVMLATLLALAAYPVAKNVFAGIVGKPLPALISFPVYFALMPVLFILVIGLLAGIYPAVRLSSVNMIAAMKGVKKTVGAHSALRRSLVGFQFAVALVVLVSTAVISQQVTYFFGNGLGYNKEYLVAAQVPRDWTKPGVDKMIAVRDQFARMPQVKEVSLSYEIPNGNNGGIVPVYKSGEDSMQARTFQLLSTDENYLRTYSLSLKSGRFFEGHKKDSGQVVLNETGIAALGYKNAEAAIGKQVRIPGDPAVLTIKAVLKDFHFGAMSGRIAPIMLFNVNFNPTYRFLTFKLKAGNMQQALEAVQKKWTSLIPEASFEYRFMDDALRIIYAKELQLQKAAYAATLLTIVIVLLGVFSMVSLSIQQKVKEIGVRRVLGASVGSIVGLFTKEFIVILLMAILVALPVGYAVMENWLRNYAYRIPLSVEPFAAAVTCIALLTFLLIGLQTVKAALANPVRSLRNE